MSGLDYWNYCFEGQVAFPIKAGPQNVGHWKISAGKFLVDKLAVSFFTVHLATRPATCPPPARVGFLEMGF